jgi:hypothetical protein
MVSRQVSSQQVAALSAQYSVQQGSLVRSLNRADNVYVGLVTGVSRRRGNGGEGTREAVVQASLLSFELLACSWLSVWLTNRQDSGGCQLRSHMPHLYFRLMWQLSRGCRFFSASIAITLIYHAGASWHWGPLLPACSRAVWS